jgi:hypothetical protein
MAPVRRGALVTLLALGSGLVVVGAGAGGSAPGEPACRSAEVRIHDEVVFGHVSSRAAARKLAERATRRQLMGVKVEADGCGDYEVEIDGADTERDRSSFAAEAAALGFDISYEQEAPPLGFEPGHVIGVLGRLRTLDAANTLQQRLARLDFRYTDVVPHRKQWWVVMPQVPVKAALSIAKEVATAGYRVQFQEGAKG